jgi:pimeloyl-ACP methyl ester carboxylesterase
MATFVLVHGAWPGAWCWERVAPFLHSAGHVVVAPTLSGLGHRRHELTPDVGMQTHVADVLAALGSAGDRPVVLVGHSYGGLVLAGAASARPERIARLIYLDALVPEDGQSFLSYNSPGFAARAEAKAAESPGGLTVAPFPLAVLGVTDPADVAWAEPQLAPQPIRTWREPVHVSARSLAIPSTYIHAMRGSFAETAARCRRRGWPVLEIDSGHEPMITAPRALAQMLLGPAAGLEEQNSTASSA